jgi:hypothetical protein
MGHGGVPQHPMKMGGRLMRTDSVVSGPKTAILQGLPDAMNMAWTTGATSTMFAALHPTLTLTVRKVRPMRTSIKLSSAVASVFLLAGMSQAMAQVAPTMQEKMACRSDAESLCAEHIGKLSEMSACLRENKAKLSVPCRKVVEVHGG